MTGSEPPIGPWADAAPPPPPPPPPPLPPAGPSGTAAPVGFPSGPHRLHPSSPVLELLVALRQWAFFLIFVVIASDQRLVLGPVALVVLALVAGWRVLAWSRFSYELRDGVLVIDKGIVQRSHREVPLTRIQQVDLRRKLRHRVLGVAVVRIDTASGGSQAEVVLEAIDDDQALRLRSALVDRAPAARATPAVGEAAAPGGQQPDGHGGHDGQPWAPAPAGTVEEIVSLSTRQLVVAGLTGSRLAAALPIVGAGVGLLFELPQETSEDVIGALPTGVGAFIVAAVVAVPFVLLAAVASSLLTDHGFTMVRVGSDLHVKRGLLDQREATISLHRVQAIRVRENPVRRRLGIAAVELQSAGSGHQAEGDVSRLTVPYVRVPELAALLADVLPVPADHPPLIAAPASARRRSWVRRFVPAALVLVPLAAWSAAAVSGWLAITMVLLAPFALGAELAFRNLGHAATPVLVVARNGTYERATAYIPVAKTQSAELESSPFQRRVGLATLHLHVAGAGSTPEITDGDAALLVALRAAALDARAARADEGAVRRRARAEVA